MAFDGIIFIDGPLKIRRPKDYGGPQMIQASVHVPGVLRFEYIRPCTCYRRLHCILMAYMSLAEAESLSSMFFLPSNFHVVRFIVFGVSTNGKSSPSWITILFK